MSVYVDDANISFRGMRMNHMVADTTAELLAMADEIGVARKWIQAAGTYREHFDVCQAKRKAAIAAGAKPVTQMEIGRMLRNRRQNEVRSET